MRCSKLTKSGLRGCLLRGIFLAATAAVMFIATTPANAACGHPGKLGPGMTIQMPFLSPGNAGPNTNNSIVGLWHVTYTMSDGTPFYEAFDVWHSDGTEFENAGLPPAEGNVCMGVWKQDGQTVRLDHIGWAFNDDGSLAGTFTLTEKNVVNGNTYEGTFVYQAYGTDGSPIPDQKVTGRLVARRLQ